MSDLLNDTYQEEALLRQSTVRHSQKIKTAEKYHFSYCQKEMLLTVLLILLALIFLIWYKVTQKWGYFSQKGIIEAPNSFPFGSKTAKDIFTGKISSVTANDWIYETYPDEPLVGIFTLGTPSVVINDLDLAKKVLISDFDHFTDRRPIRVNEEHGSNKYFARMLMTSKGQEWKKMRQILTPIFTGGKLRSMGPLIEEAANDLIEHLAHLASNGQSFEAKKLMSDFTMDSMSICGLGTHSKAFKDPDGKFRQMISKLLGIGGMSKWAILRMMTIVMMPKLADWLKLEFFDREAAEFLVEVIRQAVENRKQNDIIRYDFIHLIIATLEQHDEFQVRI